MGPSSEMDHDKGVLRVAERWFRGKLRGDTVVLEHEVELFTALAERQDAIPDAFIPKDPSVRVAAEPQTTTLPPPSSGAHANLIQQSRASLAPFPLRPKS